MTKIDFHTSLTNLYKSTRKKVIEKEPDIDIGNEIIETNDGLKWKQDKEGNLIEV